MARRALYIQRPRARAAARCRELMRAVTQCVAQLSFARLCSMKYYGCYAADSNARLIVRYVTAPSAACRHYFTGRVVVVERRPMLMRRCMSRATSCYCCVWYENMMLYATVSRDAAKHEFRRDEMMPYAMNARISITPAGIAIHEGGNTFELRELNDER